MLAPDKGDTSADQTVDVKGVYADDHAIYLPASVGGHGPHGNQACVHGFGDSYGCFRLAFFRSTTPLGLDAFNRQVLDSPMLPYNPVDYFRFYHDRDGQLRALTYYINPQHDYSYPYTVEKGLWSQPIDLTEMHFAAK